LTGRQIEPGVFRSGFEGGQRLFDGRGYRVESGVTSGSKRAMTCRQANQELGEIPLNLSARLRIHGFVRQELVERGDVFAFHDTLAIMGRSRDISKSKTF